MTIGSKFNENSVDDVHLCITNRINTETIFPNNDHLVYKVSQWYIPNRFLHMLCVPPLWCLLPTGPSHFLSFLLQHNATVKQMEGKHPSAAPVTSWTRDQLPGVTWTSWSPTSHHPPACQLNQSPLVAPPSSLSRDMDWRPSNGSSTTRRLGQSWAEPPWAGSSSPSSTSSTTPVWQDSGSFASPSSSSSLMTKNQSGSKKAVWLGTVLL